tara:strand:+ start:141 stop:308 length:168 start_codon:yes stop_codon:yes gene_type:complete
MNIHQGDINKEKLLCLLYSSLPLKGGDYQLEQFLEQFLERLFSYVVTFFSEENFI